MAAEPSESLKFLPVALNLRGRDCRVVGGGSVGTRKVLTLMRVGADVTVISPAVTDELAGRIEAGAVRWVNSHFAPEHLGGAFLVIAATDDEAVNAAVVRQAGQSGTLVCDASSAERSEVIFGALLDADDVTMAFFTHGRDPRLARKARDQVASLLGGSGGREG